jgi:hypothetical protein
MKAKLLSSHQEVYDEDLDVEKICGLCCMAGNKNAEDLIKVVDINGSVYWCDEIAFMESFDWQSFRTEAAKDILCAMLNTRYYDNEQRKQGCVEEAIYFANELIKELKEKEEK